MNIPQCILSCSFLLPPYKYYKITFSYIYIWVYHDWSCLLVSRSCLFIDIIIKWMFAKLSEVRFSIFKILMRLTFISLNMPHMKSHIWNFSTEQCFLETMKLNFGDKVSHCFSFYLIFKEVESMWSLIKETILGLGLAYFLLSPLLMVSSPFLFY